MPDSLSALAQTIALHLTGLTATTPDCYEASQHLRASVDCARHKSDGKLPSLDASNQYGLLVSRVAALSAEGGVADIARALSVLEKPLPWTYHYAPRSSEEDLSDRIAFAELIGPDGPLYAPACRVGFTVMAEQTSYPLHAHPAVELYLVISGLAKWHTPRVEHHVPPGDLVLHAANEPHAMRTYGEPLLALWSWSGEIDPPSVYL